MRALLIVTVVTLSACELQEITVARPDDVVIAQVVLRAGESLQTAYLHRTSSDLGTARVLDAHVTVLPAGSTAAIRFDADADSLCLRNAPLIPESSVGTCYVARGTDDMVRPGRRYELHIALPDGRALTGSTQVPGEFALTTPPTRSCYLPPSTILELRWRQAADASVYIISTRSSGLRQALRRSGVQVAGDDPVDLFGLSITAADTLLSFPDQLGIFNRFDNELHAILIAIRTGLPPGVRVDGVVAAADRNYVNWIRGGNFNPSGLVRISSVQGDGHGVFGSLSLARFEIRTSPQTGLLRCH